LTKLSEIPFLPHDRQDAVALVEDSGIQITYRELADKVRVLGDSLSIPKSLVFLYTANDVESVVRFVASLYAGHAVALLDPALPSAARVLLESRYRPGFVFDPMNRAPSTHASGHSINDSLSVLLSTSGSTGGSKFVRLTLANLEANAKSIATSLRVSSNDVAAGHLPLHYSYGLSVLLSHLVTGAKTVITSHGLMDRELWSVLKMNAVTHFPGVPFHYEMLLKLGFERLGLESIRTLTQAGGHLRVELREKAYRYMNDRGGRFYVMYGQTEAAPRITTLDHEMFLDHRESVGRVIPGGRLIIRDEAGSVLPAGREGIVWYEGPNVMMGYAESIADLARGDELSGVLATGDIGRLTDDGHLTITGRVKRMGKIYGLRVNLDEIERLAKVVHAQSAVVQQGEKITVMMVASLEEGPALIEKVRVEFARHFTVPATAYQFKLVEEIPTTSRGKVDYQRLQSVG
jgi:acyl-CoA synthetase (AMP-forming)/AMP-acid ligase II